MSATMRAPMPRDVQRLLTAVVVSGFAAAIVAEPILWLFTPIIAFAIVRSARQATRTGATVSDSPLPPSVQEAVDSVRSQIFAGEAESLLLDVVRHASALHRPHESAFDARHDAELRGNVCELVLGCCKVTLQLAQMDELRDADIIAARNAGDREAIRLKYGATRELLSGQLRNAASVLTDLYVSGVKHGTPSTERVAALVDEIRRDAAARDAAGQELEGLHTGA
jgi:hypothetical protein